jgi:hypothetical protein
MPKKMRGYWFKIKGTDITIGIKAESQKSAKNKIVKSIVRDS